MLNTLPSHNDDKHHDSTLFFFCDEHFKNAFFIIAVDTNATPDREMLLTELGPNSQLVVTGSCSTMHDFSVKWTDFLQK